MAGFSVYFTEAEGEAVLDALICHEDDLSILGGPDELSACKRALLKVMKARAIEAGWRE